MSALPEHTQETSQAAIGNLYVQAFGMLRLARVSKGRKVSFTVHLTEEQLTTLQALSRHTKIPVAVYVRQAIDATLLREAWRIL